MRGGEGVVRFPRFAYFCCKINRESDDPTRYFRSRWNAAQHDRRSGRQLQRRAGAARTAAAQLRRLLSFRRQRHHAARGARTSRSTAHALHGRRRATRFRGVLSRAYRRTYAPLRGNSRTAGRVAAAGRAAGRRVEQVPGRHREAHRPLFPRHPLRRGSGAASRRAAQTRSGGRRRDPDCDSTWAIRGWTCRRPPPPASVRRASRGGSARVPSWSRAVPGTS